MKDLKEIIVENPWKKLSTQAPYVLPDDQKVLGIAGMTEDFGFKYDILPEPFIGAIATAKVILLNLNPGFDIEDILAHSRTNFRKALKRNLQQVSSEYPFYPLDPGFSKTPVYKWWNKKLRQLIKECGRTAVSQNIACIEFFPYHSKKWFGLNKLIPSQEYAFCLVRQAVRDKKLILIMRAKHKWFDCVPELITYPNLLRLNSSQNVSVSKKNVSDGKFAELVRSIVED